MSNTLDYRRYTQYNPSSSYAHQNVLWLYVLCYILTKNTLDCDQSNYSSRIVFSHIPVEFVQTGISAIRSADLENPTVEPNMKWIG